MAGIQAPGPDRTLSGPGARLVAERLLGAVREEIARADTKASILLSGAVAVIAVALPGRSDGLFSGPAGAVAAAVTGLALWTAGIGMLVAAVLPRTKHRRWRRPHPDPGNGGVQQTFFASISRGVTVELLLPGIAEAGRDPSRWMLQQACALGAILAAKYRWMNAGVCCLSASGLLVLVAWPW